MKKFEITFIEEIITSKVVTMLAGSEEQAEDMVYNHDYDEVFMADSSKLDILNVKIASEN